MKVTFINPEQGVPWTNSLECGAKSEAKNLGVDLTVQGTPAYSVPNVTQIMNAVAATEPEGVVMPVWDPVAYDGSIASMTSAGAEFAAVDGYPEDLSNVLAAVTSSNYKGGLLAAEAMLTKVKAGESVLVMENSPANEFQAERGKGFISTLEKEGIEVLPVQYSEQNATKAASIVSATLASHPDLAGIYVTDGTDPAAIHTALAQEGKTGQVSVVAYDASPEQVEEVESGELLATVAQRPDIEAEEAVKFLVEAKEGKSVPKITKTQVNLVTKANLKEPETQEALYKEHC
jgi:ribose transport system substrate-binding protein